MGSPALAKDAISGADAFYAFQRITSLTVTPQPNAVLLDFLTHLPTCPVVEIFRELKDHDGRLLFVKENFIRLAFDFLDAALGNYFTDHHARLDGLDQATSYSYRITAGDGPRRAAVAIGTFKTGRRSARVVFSSIEIWNDGDPGLKASGEMVFGAGFYEGTALHSSRDDFSRSMESGEIVYNPFGAPPALSNATAPDSVAVYLLGIERDGFGPPAWPPKQLPEAPFHREEDTWVQADAFRQFELPNTLGAHKLHFTLDCGPWGIHFKMNGWIDVNVSNPLPTIKRSFTSGSAAASTAVLARVGARQSVHSPAGRSYTFGLGPNGVIAQRMPHVRQKRRRDWALIPTTGADSVTLIACDEHWVNLVTVDKGTVRKTRRALQGESQTPQIWTVIGQDMQPALTALPQDGGAAVLVGLTSKGEVKVTLLRADDNCDISWHALGGNFQGRVAARQVSGGVELFAVTATGEVQTTIWNPPVMAQPRWFALGGKSVAHVISVVDPKGPHLVAFTHERELLVLSHEGPAWGVEWRPLGMLDDMGLEERAAALTAELEALQLAEGPTPCE